VLVKEITHFRSKQSFPLPEPLLRILYFTFDDCLSTVDTEEQKIRFE
jgi:hypothetical protein